MSLKDMPSNFQMDYKKLSLVTLELRTNHTISNMYKSPECFHFFKLQNTTKKVLTFNKVFTFVGFKIETIAIM
jgi:hypothetical protein